MAKLISRAKVNIHVESEKLVMYGAPGESAGCVLRGIMSLKLQEPTKIKSIALDLVGKMEATYCTEGSSNSQGKRLLCDEETVLCHTWRFLPKETKMYPMNAGNYTYEFEYALPGDLPESTCAPNLYTVQYYLKATIERTTFVPNLTLRKPLYVSRQIFPLAPEFLEPVAIANQWANKLDYKITLPRKIYTYGDQVLATIRITSLTDSLRVRNVSCALKEYVYVLCTNENGTCNSRPRMHSQVIFSAFDHKFGRSSSSRDSRLIEWTKAQTIPLPTSAQDMQCDVQNESIRIQHKVKFVLSLINADGHVSELRVTLPITICAVNNSSLPAYEEALSSSAYDPTTFMALLYQQTTTSCSISSVPLQPTYETPPPPYLLSN